MAGKRVCFAARRKVLGYSQEQLAERLGVERSTVVRWERGETAPQPWFRPRLARALRVTVEELDGLLAETTETNIPEARISPDRPGGGRAAPP